MKVNIQFINAELDEETKLTTVSVRYINKVFYGYSKPHPQDLEHFSKIRGGRIAHLKAVKNAFSYIIEEKQKLYNKSHKKRLLKEIEELNVGIQDIRRQLKEIRKYQFDK